MIYRFGEFYLDTGSLELKQNGQLLGTEPQVFSLLIYLIENRDRVVSKDELIQEVWGGRIITDGALNTRINSLRRAVGDDGKTQALIKTFQRRGFRFVADIDAEEVNESPAHHPRISSHKPSIAVLPFKNLSDDPGQEYFADGITEDLIIGISKLSGLLVIGCNSSFFYKGKSIDLKVIGRELGVRYILEGSVRKAGNRVRITAHLSDAEGGHNIWAERHDGALDDIFELQDEITGKILSALSVQLTRSEQDRLSSHYTDNAEAHDWFIRGRIRYREPGPQANAEALGMFDKALALDPNFAWAMAIRSYVVFHAWFFKWNTDPNGYAAALADADRAVELDANLAAAHSYLGWIRMWGDGNDHNRTIAEHQKALSLDPNFSEGYVWYASTLIYNGQPELALEPMERAMRLDPHYPPNTLINFGNMYLQLGRYSDVEKYMGIVIERAPDFPVSYIFLAAAQAAAGNLKGARATGSEIMKRIPGASAKTLARMFPYAKAEHLARLTDGLRIAGLPDA